MTVQVPVNVPAMAAVLSPLYVRAVRIAMRVECVSEISVGMPARLGHVPTGSCVMSKPVSVMSPISVTLMTSVLATAYVLLGSVASRAETMLNV